MSTHSSKDCFSEGQSKHKELLLSKSEECPGIMVRKTTALQGNGTQKHHFMVALVLPRLSAKENVIQDGPT